MKARGPRSEAALALLAHIKDHGPVKENDLVQAFGPRAAADGVAPSRWVKSRLANMQEARFVSFTPRGWVANPQAEAAATAAAKPTRAGRRRVEHGEAVPNFSDPFVAQPRRVDLFSGGTYAPPATFCRPGSNDHARCPSVINGAPRAYRSGL